jgi:Fic family protein
MDSIDNNKGKYIESIKRALYIKKIKGKDYYYIRSRFSFVLPNRKVGFSKEMYVCPTSVSNCELLFHFCLARGKSLREIYKFLYDLSEKTYRSKLLSKDEKLLLEIIRVAYNMHLKGFGDSDAKRYESAVYTKYVYGTTSIEGNTYTLRETDLTLNEGMTVGGKEKREFYEIENYSRLKKALFPLSKVKIGIPLIKKIHSIIMANIDDDAAGEFRRVDVGIRGSQFTPPPSFEVDQKMNGLVHWYKKNESKLHPLELAAIFHQKFGEIHPFVDGNGRVGRELVRLILAVNGYPTIFIDRTSREEYLKAMDEGNKGNHKPLLEFFVRNLESVHKELIERAKKSLDAKSNLANCKKCALAHKCDESIKKFVEEFGS